MRPVAVYAHLGGAHAHIRRWGESRRLEFRHLRGWPEIGPNEPAGFAHGISLLLDAFGNISARWLRCHLDDVAVDVEFPAVIQAAQAAFLVAGEHKRRATVRAK